MITDVSKYKTIYEGGIGEFIMKKSRFIATVHPVEAEEAAIEFIDEMNKKYWDASHNCYAYVIGTINPIMRCSDDGEPSQTAGKPMLDVLLSHELTNLLVVVTRYFGGTLLGTGGLVKAYQSAVIEGLNNSRIITKELGIRLQMLTDYSHIGKIQYYIGQETLPVLSSEYTDSVKLELMIPFNQYNSFVKKITDLTSGSVNLQKKEQAYFTMIDDEVYLF
ncbi:YigZ family protein [Mobilitalea sibirica]|uniref:YigZ family protein n=1 Tax=Mobilitalea sibirica TaxID=1462919 RepID=A0A8J7H1I1_9FIRM|nr:YigZ family protein [Mobilitalea sibirica]MBH1940304.1 YigZ family protein [Mobilitalea sibirica]